MTESYKAKRQTTGPARRNRRVRSIEPTVSGEEARLQRFRDGLLAWGVGAAFEDGWVDGVETPAATKATMLVPEHAEAYLSVKGE